MEARAPPRPKDRGLRAATKMKKEDNSLRSPPSLPEVAITLQKDSSIRGKINHSVEEENALLRERNRQLEATIAAKDAENTILRERETALARDGIETLNAVTEALRTIQPGKETARFLKDSEERIQNAAPKDKPLVINARIKAAAAMIRDSPAPLASTTTEGPDPLRYDTRTLNQKRGEAIAAHAQKTRKAAIKSTEAGTVLETVEEGRKLDRKTVHRAMDVARGILRASSEVVGGIRRLVIPSPSPGEGEDRHQHAVIGGGGGSWRSVTAPEVGRTLGWGRLGEDLSSGIECDQEI